MIKHTDTFYQDNMVKYECKDCGRTFIVGEEMKKDCKPGHMVCPYCGKSHIEDIVWTTDENLLEMDLGCIGLYIDAEEYGNKIPFIRFLYADESGTHRIYDTEFPTQFIAEFTDTKVTEIGGFFIMGVQQPVKTLTDAFKICKG